MPHSSISLAEPFLREVVLRRGRSNRKLLKLFFLLFGWGLEVFLRPAQCNHLREVWHLAARHPAMTMALYFLRQSARPLPLPLNFGSLTRSARVFHSVQPHAKLRESVKPAAAAAPIQLVLHVGDGVSLAAQAWGSRGWPVLALHGWLDNSNSFSVIAADLSSQGFLVVALDWPGHGLSSHRSKDATYNTADLPWYALQAANALGWKNRFALLGHSMGAGASTLLAASCYPSDHTVAALCCIDVLGPLSKPVAGTAKYLYNAMLARDKYIRRSSADSLKRAYDSFEACVNARLKTVQLLPGNQRLTWEAAACLVQRGASLNTTYGRWCFHHDPRLQAPSSSYFTEEQILDFLRSIKAPTLVIEADPAGGHAWPRSATAWEKRKAVVPELQAIVLPGGHHLHLDVDTAPAVAAAVASFFADQAALNLEWQQVELDAAS